VGNCWSARIRINSKLNSKNKTKRKKTQLFQIVEEIYKAWERIISERHGLYSVDKPEPSPLAPSEKEQLKPQPPSVNPHRIFFKVYRFILDKLLILILFSLNYSSSKNVFLFVCIKLTLKWKC